MIREDLWQKAGKLADRPFSVEAQKSQLLDRSIVVVVANPELPGCMAQGDTLKQALAELKEARQEYLFPILKAGRQVPEPKPTAGGCPRITWLEPELIDETLWSRAEALAARDYLVEFSPETLEDGSEGVLAENPEMPGCMESGRTPAEAKAALARGRHVFIYCLLEAGKAVPEPGDIHMMADGDAATIAG
ncbi:MAG: type II toxin-antitoxin system HicB family antitoxin [Anaerolineae bacterium]|nr:type II toxin-antitoxin system HicB family antitoxin [Anaerolineae bacterium]